MAAQLITALHGEFDPSQYRDEYRARVLELVEAKAAGGGKQKVKVFRPRKVKEDEITDALAASLAATKATPVKKRAARG
jgi:DNA end-binding protein Ku